MIITKENNVIIRQPSRDILSFCKRNLTLSNPKFHTNVKLGVSNFNTNRYLQYYDWDEDREILTVPIGFWQNFLHYVNSDDNRSVYETNVVDSFPPISLRPEQETAAQVMLKYTNGILSAPTGCHQGGTPILMYNGTWKLVENIKLNDIIMGWDSTPRTVTQLFQGKDYLYEVNFKKHTFRVTGEHILTLRNTDSNIKDVKVTDYLQWSKTQKHLWKLFSTAVSYPKKDLPIPPYILGVLLGDGTFTKTNVGVSSMSPEIVKSLYNYISDKNLNLSIREYHKGTCSQYYFKKTVPRSKQPNHLQIILRELNLFGCNSGNKFIPLIYKTSSLEDRLELLAGLIDTDGHNNKKCIEYVSKSKKLADDVKDLAMSCGFYVSRKLKTCKAQTGNGNLYHRLLIGGHTNRVPIRVANKKISIRKHPANVQNFRFTITKDIKDRYYGFSITGDQRYIMKNYIVTHNSGKTVIFLELIRRLRQKALVLVHTKDLAKQFQDRMKQFYNYDVGLIGTGKFETTDIAVGILQTLIKLTDEQIQILNDTYGYVIGDEIHVCGADVYFEAICKLKAKWKHGFSATPERPDGKTDVLVYATGPIRHQITFDEVQDELCFPTFEYIETNFEFPIFSSREYNDLLNEMAEDDERNQLIVDQRNRYPDKHAVILCKRKEHMERLSRMIPDSRFLHSKVANKERQKRLADFFDGKYHTLISSFKLLGTGIDDPNIDLLILAAPTNNKIDVKQSLGRTMRKGTNKESLIIDIVDKKIGMLVGMFKNRKKWYKEYIEMEKKKNVNP